MHIPPVLRDGSLLEQGLGLVHAAIALGGLLDDQIHLIARQIVGERVRLDVGRGDEAMRRHRECGVAL